jgi:hypothetical protein
MNIGDKVLAEGEVTQVCDGFCVVRFARVGTQAVTHLRVPNEALHSPRVKAEVVLPAPKPRKVPVVAD